MHFSPSPPPPPDLTFGGGAAWHGRTDSADYEINDNMSSKSAGVKPLWVAQAGRGGVSALGGQRLGGGRLLL